ncbi:odorant receptor 131-2-like [Aulostomus maculatus]
MSLQPDANSTRALAPQEIMLFGLLSVGSSCSFLYINCVLLITLRSKQEFYETPRYILLSNLLFSDSAHMVSNLLLYLLSSLRVQTAYYTCGTLVLLSVFTATISPFTLAVMSVERFVAVSYPLRHATIFTRRRTSMAITLSWVVSFIHILIRVFILLYFLTKISMNVPLNVLCFKEVIFFAPLFHDFEEAYAGTLFVVVGVAIVTSYVGVALITRSVSTNRTSARKALQTLLLHLIQLSLILISTMFSTIILVIIRTAGRSAILRVYNICFVCLNVLPRCLSALIYGLRDQAIRPLLLQNLCCWNRCSLFFTRSL